MTAHPSTLEGRAAAERFVDLLTHGLKGSLCWRLLHDSNEDANGINFDFPLARVFDDFEERQADGYGVFAVVNGGGHRDAHIDQIRAVFIDADNVPLPKTWHLEPHFIVRRDGTHWHAYWLTSGMTPEQFTEVQKRLAVHYGTDRAISNPSRVMRVAGFAHLKNPRKPQAVSLIDKASSNLPGEMQYRHSYEEVTAGLPELPDGFSAPNHRTDPRREQPLGELDLPHNIEEAKEFLAGAPPAIAYSHEGGNNRTYQTACEVRDRGVSEAVCRKLMHESEWNRGCKPPWSFDELEEPVGNAYRYGQNRAGEKRVHLMDAQILEFRKSNQFRQSLDRLAEDAAPLDLGNRQAAVAYELDDDIPADFPDDDEIPNDNEPPANRWPGLVYRGDALASIKPPIPIIPGYLLSRGVTALLAPRRSGKTIVALDLGLCLATDSEWAGERVAPGWHVVYLCGEDHENAAAHVQAWAKDHHGGNVPDRFTFVRDVPDLLSGSNRDVAALVDTLSENIPEGARVLWVVDTWQRATTGGGQNEDADMKAAFRNLEALADSFLGAAIGCFHPPKNDSRTISGAMFQENAAVAILQVEKVDPEKPDSERKLTVANIKGRGEGNHKLFRFREVEIGEPDSTFGQRPVGVIAEHVGGTGESQIVKLKRQEQEREESAKLAEDTLALVASLLADGWRILGSNRGGGAGALKPSDIAKRLKVRPEKVQEALAQLMAAGRLCYREAHGKAKASYALAE